MATIFVLFFAECVSMQADIVFVVESLESLGERGWHVVLEVITLFIAKLNPKQRLTMEPSWLHFGVVTYSTTAHVRLPLGHYLQVSVTEYVQ